MRAGDTVKHGPSGETWQLSTNPVDGWVTWYGWPEGEAKESDCTLVEACTDDEHRKTLEEWGTRPRRAEHSVRYDVRYLRAHQQLCDLNQDFIGAGI